MFSCTETCCFYLLRSQPNGNCLYSSISLLLFGNNKFVEDLRALTSLELFLNASYYCKHPHFLSVSKIYGKSDSFFFTMAIKNCTIDSDLKNEEAVKFEAIANAKDKEWCSFLCLLALSSVIRRKIFSLFPDCDDSMQKHLRNQLIFPREECLLDIPLYILHCKMGGSVLNPRTTFHMNHFVPLIKFYSLKRKCGNDNSPLVI